MKKLLILGIAVLFLIGFSYPIVVHARGGHGGGGHGGGHSGGHGSGRGGFHGGHAGGSHGGGGSRAGFQSFGGHRFRGASSSFGWYGVGLFGAPYPDPWYYYGTPYYDDPYADPYSIPLASGYPDDAASSEGPEAVSEEMQGEWVVVPGQSVDGRWIPPHEAWAPKSP